MFLFQSHSLLLGPFKLKGIIGLYFLGNWVILLPMEKNYEKYTGRGKPDTESPRHIPLGKLLRDARDQMGWTRERLAHATGVGTSSIVRYEMAGLEADGQYPKSQSLAKLCLALEIDPLQGMLACLPPEDFGMYENLANSQVWKYNNAQYFWLERQLEISLKDTMLLRSFIEHFFPYIDKKDLPEELLWLYHKGRETLERLTELEARMLQIGVFIMPFGGFLSPGGVTDEDNQPWIFEFDQPGVIDRKNIDKIRTVIKQSLTRFAERFAGWACELENLEEERERHQELIYKITGGREGSPPKIKSPEIDLPSSPSSNSKPIHSNMENDDEQSSG